ncbi:MAG TPA: uracil-DNA glycosylase [Isosphaeraceae bacterium]|nr:uracil-DNA glycosylase [Isosphaeraceae bacterium]
MSLITTGGPAAAALIAEVSACQRCARMGGSRRVLSERNGSWSARVLFVAEAPGRLGAERSGIPLCGDQAGIRFERLLDAMSWSRLDVFITNAVLCNPRDGKGRNATPTRRELANCTPFLSRTIALVDPALVIALGSLALEAMGRLGFHGLSLSAAAGTLTAWNGRMLGVLYHPGARAARHRPWPAQLADARRLARAAERAGCGPRCL